METESVKRNQEKEKRPRRTRKLLLLLCVVLVVAAAVTWMLTVGNVVKQLTVEAGAQSVDANAFLRIQLTDSAVFVSDLSIVDLNQPDDYPVQIRVGLFTYDRVLQVRDTVSPTATVTDLSAVSVSMPAPDDFIVEIQDVTPVVVHYAAQPDMRQEGDQTVELLLTDTSGNTTAVQTTLTVIMDREPPVLEGVKPLLVYVGQTPDYTGHVTVSDNLDRNPVMIVDSSRVDLSRAGTYNVYYRAVDISGNETELSDTVTVIFDNTAPIIYGVQNISLYAGSTVSYRNAVQVVDDTDAAPVLTIDSSQVDLSKPGTYPLTYTATDGAGNANTLSATVTVSEKSKGYVDEEVIYAAADRILAKIIDDDMTNEEKVRAIHRYISRHYYYSSRTDRNDWLQAAYQIMTQKNGNCISFYAVSKLMFDRLGLPNMTVQRVPTKYRESNHFWNMVSIDNGETWYYYDATPTIPSMSNKYLMTDADLDWYNRNCNRDFYNWDRSLYPATPEE